MCGRFTITLEAPELIEDLGVAAVPEDWRPRYNVAPTQPVGAVLDFKTKQVQWLKWGLIPSWAKDASIGSRLINARAETIAEKPSFRSAFARRRCLILADGFYEWQHSADKKGPSTPYYFSLLDHKPFAFAGLWESWQPAGGEVLNTCTIITCEANSVLRPVHDRMPVMLTGEELWRWLSAADIAGASGFLRPFPPEKMQAVKVSRMVNDVNRDSSECIQPIN